MTKICQVTPTVRLVKRMMQVLVRLRLGPKQTPILTVRGRKSGKLYTTPISLVEDGDNHWLVAPYGEVNWVRNARVTGEVTLTRGCRPEMVNIVEVGPKESAPVLQKHIEQKPITQPHFNVEADASLEEFVAQSPRHLVFQIIPINQKSS